MKKIALCMIALMTLAACQNQGSKVPALDLGNLDTSVSPGEDFYDYATRGWREKNPLGAEYSRFGTFDQLRENNVTRLNDLFASMATMETKKGTVEQKIVDLYKQGLDSTRLNEEGAAPLQKYIAEVQAISDKKELAVALAKMHDSGVGGFFGCTLEGTCKVENSYFNGDLEAQVRGWVGGFVGLIDKAESTVTIQNCVSIGNCSSYGDGSPHVTAPFIAGNGAGENPNAIVFFKDNISNIDATMDAAIEWPDVKMTADGGDVILDEQLNVDDLKEQDPYTGIGWDFAGTWGWDKSNYDFPVLKLFGYVPYKIETGIQNVNVNDNVNLNVNAKGVFDLSGRRVNINGKLPKGIYVIDGHKIVVK